MSKNFVYHQNFFDTIRDTKDAEKLRCILKKVETEITGLTADLEVEE